MLEAVDSVDRNPVDHAADDSEVRDGGGDDVEAGGTEAEATGADEPDGAATDEAEAEAEEIKAEVSGEDAVGLRVGGATVDSVWDVLEAGRADADEVSFDDCIGGHAEEVAEDHEAETALEDTTVVEAVITVDDVHTEVACFDDDAAGAVDEIFDGATDTIGIEGEEAEALDCGAPGLPGPPPPQEA